MSSSTLEPGVFPRIACIRDSVTFLDSVIQDCIRSQEEHLRSRRPERVLPEQPEFYKSCVDEEAIKETVRRLRTAEGVIAGLHAHVVCLQDELKRCPAVQRVCSCGEIISQGISPDVPNPKAFAASDVEGLSAPQWVADGPQEKHDASSAAADLAEDPPASSVQSGIVEAPQHLPQATDAPVDTGGSEACVPAESAAPTAPPEALPLPTVSNDAVGSENGAPLTQLVPPVLTSNASSDSPVTAADHGSALGLPPVQQANSPAVSVLDRMKPSTAI